MKNIKKIKIFYLQEISLNKAAELFYEIVIWGYFSVPNFQIYSFRGSRNRYLFQIYRII